MVTLNLTKEQAQLLTQVIDSAPFNGTESITLQQILDIRNKLTQPEEAKEEN